MPVQPCTTEDGKPGRRYGKTGHCYPCEQKGDCAKAEAKAAQQGRAVKASQAMSGKPSE